MLIECLGGHERCLHAFCRKRETSIPLLNKFEQQVMVCGRIPLVIPAAKLKGLAQAKIIKKSVILFRVLNMTI